MDTDLEGAVVEGGSVIFHSDCNADFKNFILSTIQVLLLFFLILGVYRLVKKSKPERISTYLVLILLSLAIF